MSRIFWNMWSSWLSISLIWITLDKCPIMQMKDKSDFWNATLCASACAWRQPHPRIKCQPVQSTTRTICSDLILTRKSQRTGIQVFDFFLTHVSSSLSMMAPVYFSSYPEWTPWGVRHHLMPSLDTSLAPLGHVRLFMEMLAARMVIANWRSVNS